MEHLVKKRRKNVVHFREVQGCAKKCRKGGENFGRCQDGNFVNKHRKKDI
jgi:hypothetical protein